MEGMQINIALPHHRFYPSFLPAAHAFFSPSQPQ
jgi:hypothetical protein